MKSDKKWLRDLGDWIDWEDESYGERVLKSYMESIHREEKNNGLRGLNIEEILWVLRFMSACAKNINFDLIKDPYPSLIAAERAQAMVFSAIYKR